jgi:hypothetical protein
VYYTNIRLKTYRNVQSRYKIRRPAAAVTFSAEQSSFLEMVMHLILVPTEKKENIDSSAPHFAFVLPNLTVSHSDSPH